jgi:hypothetical protein
MKPELLLKTAGIDTVWLIALLDKFAMDNYTKGFDYWIETLSKNEKLALVDSGNIGEALAKFIDWNWDNGIQYSAIKAEQCMLYEVDKKQYDSIQENAEQSRQGLLHALLVKAENSSDIPVNSLVKPFLNSLLSVRYNRLTDED